MEIQIESRKPTKGCEHCPNNPQATKPFLKTTQVPIGGRVFQDLEETAKLRKEPLECFICDLVQDMVNGLEKTDVAIKIPENELKLLEDQGFFGKSKDQWLSKAIQEAIVEELDAMHDSKRIRALEKKYNLMPQEVKDFFGKD